MIILLKWPGLILHSLISDNIQFILHALRRGTCVQCSINRLNIERKWKKGSIKEYCFIKFFSSAEEIVAGEPVLVNSKPTVLRTVDKSRPADWTANRQKKARVCSPLVPHFDMRYNLRFDMTAAKSYFSWISLFFHL